MIKELIRADWLRIAASIGGNALSIMGTDTLLNQLTSGVRSFAGKAGAFKRLERALLHVGGDMLQIELLNGKYELLPFSHEYYSRNPIPVNFNPKAKCPKFRKLLKDQVSSEDQSLINAGWALACFKATRRNA